MRIETCFMIVFASLTLFPIGVSAQEKGISPVPAEAPAKEGEAYAVVIGISDYQDPGIPDLRFADKDAEAFAGYLQSQAGGALDEDHLKLLTNKAATTGQIVAVMDWLVDVCKEGDQAIIYFSGHGDVESKSAFNLGFLLTWDSPSKAYMAGAYPLFYLQAMVSTLSTENKTKVLLITDACRSGKLAGSEIAGSQLTSANLAKQFANEIKILSCQPDQYSIEGEQWGGGRGAFSYHLLEGLYGMADNNQDLSVNLMEIRGYLEQKVSSEVAPQQQLPMTIGNGLESLFSVDTELLAQIQENKIGQMELFAATDSRGMEDDVLASVDTTVRETYRLFKSSLKEKIFLEPLDASNTDGCANAYYEKLTAEPRLEPLYASMRRNYAASLQDEAQQVLNKILNNDENEMSLSKVNQITKYRLYPDYLQKASDLLGKDHYMYAVLQARKFYFEGYMMHAEDYNPNRELGEKALSKYRAALSLQPDFPHPYYSMAAVHYFQMQQPDSSEFYIHRAVEAAPSWFSAYTAMARMYLTTGPSSNHEKVFHFLNLAEKIDAVACQKNVWHLLQWARYYGRERQYEETERILKNIIQLDDQYAVVYRGLSFVYSKNFKNKKAIEQLRKAIELDPTNHESLYNLGQMFSGARRYVEAEEIFKQGLQLDSNSVHIIAGLGAVYLFTGKFEEGEQLINKAIELAGPNTCLPCLYNNIALAYIAANRLDRAEEYCFKTLELDSNEVEAWNALAWLNMKNKLYSKAEKLLLRSLSIEANEPTALAHIALIYIYEGKYELSEKRAKQVIQHHPMNPNGPSNLGFLYIKTGRFVEAEQQLKKGLALQSDDTLNAPNTLVYLALLSALKNEDEDAFEYLEKAVRLNPYVFYLNIDLKTEPAFAPLRAQKDRWEVMIKRFYPEEKKD